MKTALRSLALATAGVATAGVALVTVAAPAAAVGARYSGNPVGSLDIRPANGTNQSAIDYTSSAPCPAGTSFETRLFGFGMPDAGEIVTSRTTAGFSTTGPVSSSFSNTPQFFADKNSTTLQGSYDVVLRCTDRFGDASRGDFLRIITFTSPTAYRTEPVTGPSPSPSPSAAASPSPSPSASSSPTASASPTVTMSSSPPPPSGAPSECAVPASVSLGRQTIVATGATGATVRATPGRVVKLFAYSQPSTSFREVRSTTLDSSGSITYQLKPATNTKLYAQQVGCDPSGSVVLNVRTLLSLKVVRNGVRNYTFDGIALPARRGGLIVSLYRVRADGRQVLTSQTRASATDGAYRINRRFLGTGRFGFVVRTGQDLQNAPGSSNVRSLLVF